MVVETGFTTNEPVVFNDPPGWMEYCGLPRLSLFTAVSIVPLVSQTKYVWAPALKTKKKAAVGSICFIKRRGVRKLWDRAFVDGQQDIGSILGVPYKNIFFCLVLLNPHLNVVPLISTYPSGHRVLFAENLNLSCKPGVENKSLEGIIVP